MTARGVEPVEAERSRRRRQGWWELYVGVHTLFAAAGLVILGILDLLEGGEVRGLAEIRAKHLTGGILCVVALPMAYVASLVIAQGIATLRSRARLRDEA